MKRRRGFTFFEILMVLMLIATLAVVAFPRMGGVYRQSQLRAGARELTQTLRLARQAAILSGDGCQVRIDPEGGRYQLAPLPLDAEGDPIETRREYRRREDSYHLNAEATQIRTLPGNVFFTLVHSTAPLTQDTRVPRVIFYPDGSATAAYLGIQSTDDDALSVRIYRTTGLAKVETGDPVLPENTEPLFYLPDKIEFQPMQ
jgi:type II secretion system protein H